MPVFPAHPSGGAAAHRRYARHHPARAAMGRGGERGSGRISSSFGSSISRQKHVKPRKEKRRISTLRRRFRWRKKVQPFSSPKTQSANRRHRLRWTCPHVWRRIRILSHGCGFRRRTWIIPSCRRMIPMIT